VRSNAPFGAGGADVDKSPSSGAGPTKLASGQTAAGALSTYLICQAQMGPTGAATYYNTTNQAGAAGGAVFAWLNEGGNPNLRSETADTWTAGFVISDLGQSPWISGLSGSIDWWQYNIKNAIELDSPDYANYLCYGTNVVNSAAGAATQALTPACLNVNRLPTTGGAQTALLVYTNQATIGEAGFDLQLNWIAQLQDIGLHVPGAIAFNTQDTFLNYFRTKSSPASFDVNVNWKDSLGPNLQGTNGGAYGFRLTGSIGYVLPSFTVNLRARFYPSANSVNKAFQEAIIDHNAAVTKSGQGTLLSYTPNRDIAAPSWEAFDLSASWTINSIWQLRGGINNLFGKDPANTGKTAGFPVGTNLNAVCPANAPGCVNPLAYSLPSDGGAVTNAGYYDVYGRTFFLGFKASF
jgi:outer membrane receptor protein involved in Fe transport